MFTKLKAGGVDMIYRTSLLLWDYDEKKNDRQTW